MMIHQEKLVPHATHHTLLFSSQYQESDLCKFKNLKMQNTVPCKGLQCALIFCIAAEITWRPLARHFYKK
jgi:hypothetical protein